MNKKPMPKLDREEQKNHSKGFFLSSRSNKTVTLTKFNTVKIEDQYQIKD